MAIVSRGFRGRGDHEPEGDRLPPGQHTVSDFPVLTAGPTPDVGLDEWSFVVDGAVEKPVELSWERFRELPTATTHTDIHCVTKWSKFDTDWEGVAVDTLLELAGFDGGAPFLVAHSFGGYTTNLPVEDVTDGKAMVAFNFDGQPLEREHGGPARLLVPHLYFWKSAKWVAGLRVMDRDEPGFWEQNGYHNRGDPWKEERYWGD